MRRKCRSVNSYYPKRNFRKKKQCGEKGKKKKEKKKQKKVDTSGKVPTL